VVALWDEMRPDEAVLALARRRHGVVTARDLAHAGLTRKAIDHRVRVGWLTRIHRGIYLVGPLEAPLSRAMAGVLAVGDGAVLSHASAARVWEGSAAPGDAVVDVLVERRDARNRQGLRVHRVGDLDPRDTASRQGVPLTTPARTLLDLATELGPHELARAVEQAQLRRLTTDDQLSHLLIRCRSHRGAGPLRRVLDPGRQYTRSQAERRFLELVAAAGLPTPAANTRVAGHEVDFLWPGERLIVEVDGYAFHSSRAAFERDRARDVRLQARGYRVLRFTWRQLQGEPEAVVATIAAALALGRPIA
jgi:very-short-patch-repair endonuclease